MDKNFHRNIICIIIPQLETTQRSIIRTTTEKSTNKNTIKQLKMCKLLLLANDIKYFHKNNFQ